jgi:hypothetical protein
MLQSNSFHVVLKKEILLATLRSLYVFRRQFNLNKTTTGVFTIEYFDRQQRKFVKSLGCVLELNYFQASNLTAVSCSTFRNGSDIRRKRTSVSKDLCEDNLAISLLHYPWKREYLFIRLWNEINILIPLCSKIWRQVTCVWWPSIWSGLHLYSLKFLL